MPVRFTTAEADMLFQIALRLRKPQLTRIFREYGLRLIDRYRQSALSKK